MAGAVNGVGVTFSYLSITVAAGNPMSIKILLSLSSFKVEAGAFATASLPATLKLTSTRIPSASRFLRLDWDASIFSMATSASGTSAAMARAFLNTICLSNVKAPKLSARAKTILTVLTSLAGVGVEKILVGEVKVGAGVVEKKAVGSAAPVLNVAVVGAAVADEDVVVDGMRIMLEDIVAVTTLDEVGTGVLTLGDGVLLLLLVDANVVADAVLEESASGCEVVLDVGAGVLDDSAGLLVVLLLLVADADVVTVVVLEDHSRRCGVDVPPPMLNSEHGPPYSSGPEYPSLQIQFEILLLP